MNFNEYFCVIVCRLIMACYVGHSARDLILKDPITPHKGAPIHLTFCRVGIAVDENNKTAPDNVMYSDDVLPTPSSLTFGFHGIDPWRQSGNFPIGSSKLKMTPNPRIQHITASASS